MEQPKIPTLKDAQKPQVKIKGLGAGLTLFDRLKQFKKKDLAFILAGLGTLFMAPLAEHFMMAPENGDASLQKGWGGGSGSGGNFFGTGSSPYENGNNSIAQGGAIGGSGDIITPLNVRDPSALVMGPGGTQQPNAGSVAPPTAPPTAPSSSSEDLKDALAHSASRAASAAVKKAPLPIPKIAVGGSGLRGLGVAGGGSSASGGMAPLSSGNLGTASAGGGGLNLVRSAPNFRGAAGPRGNGPQGLDGTKRAGQNAGDAFSRTGSALSGLNAAASEQIPTGGSGFNGGGQGGAGANDKNPGGSGAGGSKSVGESLAFIEAKERMMENLKLEFEKRKLKDPELLMYGIRNDIVKASALKLGEKLTEKAICVIPGMGCPGADDDFMCTAAGSTAEFSRKSSDMTPSCTTGSGKEPAKATTGCWVVGSVTANLYSNYPNGLSVTCRSTGKGGGDKTDPKAEGGVNGSGRVSVPSGANPGSVESICAGITDTSKFPDGQPKGDKPAAERCISKQDGATKANCEMQLASLEKSMATMSNLQATQEVLSGTGKPGSSKCGTAKAAFTPTSPVKSVKGNVEEIRSLISGADGKGGLVKDIKGALNPADPDKVAKTKEKVDGVLEQWTETNTLLANAEEAIKDAALTTSGFNASDISVRKATFDSAHQDTKALIVSLRKAVDNLKPAVEGLVASGSKTDLAPAGSAKLAVDSSKAYDAKIEEAKAAKMADGKTPVMTEAEVVARPEGKFIGKTPVAPAAPATPAAPAAPTTALAAGSKDLAAVADKAINALKEIKFEGDDAAKTKAKETLVKTGDGGIAQDISNAIKTQSDVLDGIGSVSDQSTK